jgi:antitoxin (DNA-binding transcriptional repressor) of toxin-antitoxin stability system
MTDFPRIFRLRQQFDGQSVDDIRATVSSELQRAGVPQRVRPGQTVAITAGSRGIANIVPILRSLVECLRELGAEPFLVPAMGSHGGATAEGQTAVLTGYGITAESVGCPLWASMDTVVVAQATARFPIHFDRYAHEADHVLVCGRVKPHTDFKGRYQSGLAKMLLIGLGKYNGARVYHRAARTLGFDQIIDDVAPQVLSSCKILAGLAIVENAYDDTAHIEAVSPEQLLQREPELLALAQASMAKLPFDECDVLIIDEIGKNISGTGMDTNVVGRKHHYHVAAAEETPKILRIVIRGLTPQSHGNAIGLGLAEFCHTKLVSAMDSQATFVNGVTSGNVAAAMIPVHFETDRELLATALATIGMKEPAHARVMWIRNTLALSELECSEAYLSEIQQRPELQQLTGLRDIPFADDGNLPNMADLSC